MRHCLTFDFLKLICFLFLCLSHHLIAVDASIACGGFIKSTVNINYSRVSIKLFTSSGNLKYVSEGAPNNGYYFIPIYDNGDYIIKIDAPQGWKFEPSQVELTIDGSTDLCSQGQDINFNFKGFTISGKILSDGLDSGPQGVEVSLRDKSTKKVLKTTQTGVNGDYIFEELLPGSFEIVADDRKLSYLGSNLIDVKVIDDNVVLSAENLNQVILVSGYSVRGQVTSDDEPIKGVQFALYSLSGTKRIPKGCSSNPISNWKVDVPASAKYLCHTLSGVDGYFQFDNLSPGNYRLFALYRGNNIEFGVEPAYVDFKVEHEPIILKKGFKVEGFSVSGRVLVQEGGQGISGAQLLIKDTKGQQKTIKSQQNGIFHLENIKTGTYTFQVTANHYQFEPKVVKISPASPQIPDILVSAFEICGQFKFQSSPTDLGVMILHASSDGSFKHHQKVSSKSNGLFCTFLGPGKYRVEPITPKKLENELVFNPKFLELEVKNQPILDLIFSQFTASIVGNLVLKESAASVDDISIDLIEFHSGKVVSTTKPHQQNKEFKFETVFPGKYQLKVRKSENIWCWKEETKTISILDSDSKGIKFYQDGYLLTMITSHPTKAQITLQSTQKKETIEINETNQPYTHCLPEPGLYHIIPISCHLFKNNKGDEQRFIFDTKSRESFDTIVLNAVKHELSGTLTTVAAVGDSDDFQITLTRKLGENDKGVTSKLELSADKKTKDDEGNIIKIYKISLFAHPNEIIIIKPSSSQLLFKPPQFQITMGNECLENVISLKGRTGLFIKGQITPPLEGVKITLFKRKTDELLFETVTDVNGKYIGGPFDCCDGSSVREEIISKAEKEGYIFKEASNGFGNFLSEKLSALVVHVTNGDDSTEPPLPEVLISISGGSDNFRKNMITPANGVLSFIGLNPGQYFMRAVLKEYKFDPSSKIVDIKQGETVKIKVKGQRVAYSCYGTTVSLSGEPEANVLIEAVGIDGTNKQGYTCSQLQEEVFSESNGNFRIRDLKPGCDYEVSVKKSPENNGVSRSLPESVAIQIGNSDIEGIKLILLPASNTMEITGDILTLPEFWSSLKVKLFSGSGSGSDPLLASQQITSAFFALPIQVPFDGRWYTLKLESTLPAYSYSYELPSVTFKANISYAHFQLQFTPKKINRDSFHGDQNNISTGSIYTLPILLLIGFLVYNYAKVKPM